MAKIFIFLVSFFFSFFGRGGIFIRKYFFGFSLFVCVEVLRPSHPNRVMSSTVSLPTCNHTFTGQSSKQLTSIVHIISSGSTLFATHPAVFRHNIG